MEQLIYIIYVIFHSSHKVVVKPTLILFTFNSLFSVMEKLPPTSYVRLVDIWLISTQLVPFLLVVMTTTIELFQEQGADINHHGRPRSLKLLEIKHMYMTRNLLIQESLGGWRAKGRRIEGENSKISSLYRYSYLQKIF